MARAFNLEYEMEREILDSARKTVQKFSPDYDHRNLTERQNAQLKASIIQAAQQQGEILSQIAAIASTLHRLAAQIK